MKQFYCEDGHSLDYPNQLCNICLKPIKQFHCKDDHHVLDYPNQLGNICLKPMKQEEKKSMKALTFEDLRHANVQRNIEWDADGQLSGSFRATEFAGEGGELIEMLLLSMDFAKIIGRICNMVKKLEREKIGLKGSRVTFLELAAEFADCQICLDLLAMHHSVDLGEATRMKFNATSDKLGFLTRIG